LLRVGLETLREARSLDEMREAAAILLPDVETSLHSVDALIADVMEFGRPPSPNREPTAVEELIATSLDEALRGFPDANIDFEYTLAHGQRCVSVDRAQMARVFVNVLSNAVQAMGRAGTIAFGTQVAKDGGRELLVIGIRNTGSHIEPADLEKVFDPFYSKRRGGTGLGLAIAQKVVLDHGGSIRATSDRILGVTLRISLPIAQAERPKSSIALPASTTDLRVSRMRAQVGRTSEDVEVAKLLEEAERLIDVRSPLRVLVVDDDEIHRDRVRRVFQSPKLVGLVECRMARGSTEARSLHAECDLIVMDMDLGEATTGLDLVRWLRDRGSTAFICLHSDAASPEHLKTAIAMGADAAIPKPGSAGQLLKLAVFTARRLQSARRPASDAPHDDAIPPASRCGREGLPEVAVVDDSRAFMLGWRSALGDRAKLTFLREPKDFWAEQRRRPGFIENLACLITDFKFEDSDETGVSFAEEVRAVSPRLPIFLSTSGIVSPLEIGPAVTRSIPKEPCSFEQLMAYADTVEG
jgi:CheY-like chemotaxis protein